jgi:hypothetical protein
MLQEYGFKSRDYLKRADTRLRESKIESLFYAALELRCGIEARLREYVVRGPKTKTLEKIWQIGKIGRVVENVFGGDKELELKVHDSENKSKFSVFYTPVSKQLRKNGERLGNYLHHFYRADSFDAETVKQFRLLLEDTYKELAHAVSGIVLGPILRDQHGKMSLRFEMGIDTRFDRVAGNVDDEMKMDMRVLVLKKDAKEVIIKQV